MEGNIIHKFVAIVKNKLKSNKKINPSVNEYAFSSEEINDLNRKNREKILELKQDPFTKELKVNSHMKEKDVSSEVQLSSVLLKEIDPKETSEGNSQKSVLDDKGFEDEKEENETETKLDEQEEVKEKLVFQESFINLSSEHQKVVMEKWNYLNSQQLDRDIMMGKELLNHNYTITYAEEALNYIYEIRKKYDIVISYLIGFNNEKKGIMGKTLFSSRLEEEWQYLSQYIKILEKIRSFKNK